MRRLFMIEIETDNDAFYHDVRGEVARILDTVSADLRSDDLREDGHVLMDRNGNVVGTARFQLTN